MRARLLLKLSGEALAAGSAGGIDAHRLARLAAEISKARELGARIAVVLGAGNLFRGAGLAAAGMDRVTADHMGMLATCMNGLALRDALTRHGVPAGIWSGLAVPGVLPAYSAEAVRAALALDKVAILAGGTGNPFFTTDTAACLRGLELGVHMVLKATKVDGVYTADPLTHPNATRFDELDFDEALARRLKVMDATALCLCRDHAMTVIVFNMDAPDALTRIVSGDKVGTRVVPSLREEGPRQ